MKHTTPVVSLMIVALAACTGTGASPDAAGSPTGDGGALDRLDAHSPDAALADAAGLDAGASSDAAGDASAPAVGLRALASVPGAQVLVFGTGGADRANDVEVTDTGRVFLAGAEEASGDGFVCEAPSGCTAERWVRFGDPRRPDWVEGVSGEGDRLLVVGKAEGGGALGSCASRGATDGYVQLWDLDALGVESRCAQFGTSGNDEALAGLLRGGSAFVAGTIWGGRDQDATLRRFRLDGPSPDVGRSSVDLGIGAGGGSLEEAFWVAAGPTLAGHTRLFAGGRTSGDLTARCRALGGASCTGARAEDPGAADGWVAGIDSDPAGGLLLRWLHQFPLDGKDNVQAGIYVEDEGRHFLLLSGSLHEQHNDADHPSPCRRFAESRDEYSDAFVAFLELDAAGDHDGTGALQVQAWGEAACDRGESFSGVAYDPDTNTIHVAGALGGPVDHGPVTGQEDGIYARYALDLGASELGSMHLVEAIRIGGDACAGCDAVDRIYDIERDASGAVHIVGETSSTFSQAPFAQEPPRGSSDVLYVRLEP